MTFIKLDQSTTFNQIFQKITVSMHVSELLVLLAVKEQIGYIQPNINHHFVNDTLTYRQLDTAFRDSIQGKATVSIEYDAIMGRLKNSDTSNAAVELPVYNVKSEEEINSTVFNLEDCECVDTLVKSLNQGAIKKLISQFKGKKLPFKTFLAKIPAATLDAVLAFLDGLHRSNCLVDMAMESDDLFHSILDCSVFVTVNIYSLKKNERIKAQDLELLLQIVQDKSGNLMVNRKTTVGHTILDAFSVLSRAIRNNDKNAYLSVATFQSDHYSRKILSHVLLNWAMGENNSDKIDELKTRVYLEKFFKTFFYNSGFEEWAKQGLPMQHKQEILRNDGQYNVSVVFEKFFSHFKWEILFTLRADLSTVRSIIVESGPSGFGRSNRIFGETNLPYANMLLISMARLLMFTPKIRETTIQFMTDMQFNGILSKERLLLITGVADDAATILWKFYKKFEGNPKLIHQTKFVLRTNIENLLLSLYTREILDMLGTNFKPKFKLPYKLKFEQTLLNSLWETDYSLPTNISVRVSFLDAIALSYGRYLLYFLMAAPYFLEEMLPILSTLLGSETTKKKSDKLGEMIDKSSSDSDLRKIYDLFQLNTELPDLGDMKLTAKDFVKAVIEASPEEIMNKHQISREMCYIKWNPFYPIPYITSQLQALSDSNLISFRGEKRHLFPKLIKTLKEFHKNDTAFNEELTPKKRKPSPQTTDDSSNRKKRRTRRTKDVDAENLETEFNRDTDDEDDDTNTMDKKKEQFEYLFIGTPLKEEIKVEGNDEPAPVADESKQEDDDEEKPKSKPKKKKKKMSKKRRPTAKKKRRTLSRSDDADDNLEDEEVEEPLQKITRTYATLQEKQYVLEKVYRTYNFLFPERHAHICSNLCLRASPDSQEVICRMENHIEQDKTDAVDTQGHQQITPTNEEHHGQEQELQTVEKNTEEDNQEQQDKTADVNRQDQQRIAPAGEEQETTEDNQEHHNKTAAVDKDAQTVEQNTVVAKKDEQETPLYENQMNQFTTMAEVATKIFFHRQMERKPRDYIFNSFPKVLSEIVFDTVAQKSIFPQGLLDSVPTFMDQYLLKLRLSFNGPLLPEDKLFSYVKDRVQSMESVQLKLHSIFAKFPFSSTAFSTKVMYDKYYYEGYFDVKKDVISTFLTPLRKPRMVSFDTNIPTERFQNELPSNFHFLEAQLKSHEDDPWNRFSYKLKDTAKFYQEIFTWNSVISCRNLIRVQPNDEFMRIKLEEQDEKMFIEEVEFDKLFRLTTCDDKVQVSPYCSQSRYPRYHDYFKISPPITLEEYEQSNDLTVENVVAEVLGVDWGIIHRPSETIGNEENEQWFYCSDRVQMFEAFSVDPDLFNGDIDDEDENGEDEDDEENGSDDKESGDEDSDDEHSEDEHGGDEDKDEENDDYNEENNNDEEPKQKADNDYTFHRIEKKEGCKYTFTTCDDNGENRKEYELQFGIIHSKNDIQFYTFDEKIYDLLEFHHENIRN